MKDKQQGVIERKKSAVVKGQQDLVDIYLEAIREEFPNLDNRRRDSYLHQLETLAKEAKYSFDKVREIRKSTGKTLRELSAEFGLSQQTLSNYENNRIPSDRNGEDGRIFLEWLKEHGYNPFAI